MSQLHLDFKDTVPPQVSLSVPSLYQLHGYGIKLVRESAHHQSERIQVGKPADIVPLLTEIYAGSEKEQFLSILLSARQNIIGIDLVSIGTLNASLVHPREVYRTAIHQGAARLIVSHSHPSGDTTPSQEDLVITRRLSEAGDILGIDLIDHVIWAPPDRWRSLKEQGLF